MELPDSQVDLIWVDGCAVAAFGGLFLLIRLAYPPVEADLTNLTINYDILSHNIHIQSFGIIKIINILVNTTFTGQSNKMALHFFRLSKLLNCYACITIYSY